MERWLRKADREKNGSWISSIKNNTTSHIEKESMASPPATTAREVLVIPAFGKGHLFPCIQLCHQLASRGLKSLLVVFCTRAASIPPSLRHHPLIEVAVIGTLPPFDATDPFAFIAHLHLHFTLDLETLISSHPFLICAVLDDKMDLAGDTLHRLRLPFYTFYTSGAAAAALEFSAWKFNSKSLLPGQTRPIPGLPPHLALTHSDLARRTRPPGPPPLSPLVPPGAPPLSPLVPPGAPPLSPVVPLGPRGAPPLSPRVPLGPPAMPYGHHLGDRPSWLSLAESSVALLINTCDSLEHHYLDLLRSHIKVPVFEIGPLLPDTFWCAAPVFPAGDGYLLDWLDSKTPGSVLYVSFGTEVGPRLEEYPALAAALDKSNVPFIWVLQPGTGRTGLEHLAFFGIELGPEEKDEGYFPHGLERRTQGRGVVIRGWAPQTAILSHPATGGFLSHCGWNSTVEAIAHGVPLLAWPIRGDQYPNSKLVVRDLRVGRMVREGGDPNRMVEESEIRRSIRELMEDTEIWGRAEAVSRVFDNGFPTSSKKAIDGMCELVKGLRKKV